MLDKYQLYTKVKQALSWWLDGLKIPLPSSVINRFFPTKKSLLIQYKEEVFHLETTANTKHEYVRLTDLLEEHETHIVHNKLRPVVCLDSSDVLIKILHLPQTSKNDLLSLVQFELQRILPFPITQIRYAVLTADTLKDKASIMVKVAIVHLNKIQKLLSQLTAIPVQLAIVVNVDNKLLELGKQETPGMLLTPSYYIPIKKRYAATCIVGLAIFILLPLLWQSWQLNELNTKLSNNRSIALNLSKDITANAALTDTNTFITIKDNEYFSPLNIILALTQQLPEDTWLQSLTISNNKLQIQGSSPSAALTLGLIEKAGFLEKADFTTPVVSDGNTREEFQIIANLRPL